MIEKAQTEAICQFGRMPEPYDRSTIDSVGGLPLLRVPIKPSSANSSFKSVIASLLEKPDLASTTQEKRPVDSSPMMKNLEAIRSIDSVRDHSLLWMAMVF